jgi:hypothetical protein
MGLTGLYTHPTADTIPPGRTALTFSELRFSQSNATTKAQNIWFYGAATFTPSSRWELAVATLHEVVEFRPRNGLIGPSTDFDSSGVLGHVKYVITPPERRKAGLAVGVMDISDVTADVGGLETERGRRLFLVGTYEWLSLGVTQTDDDTGAFVGARWTVGRNLDIIGEYVTDPVFVGVSPEPGNKANFNLGIRFYPNQVPGLRVDVAAIGDGEFDFGFSLSYLLK